MNVDVGLWLNWLLGAALDQPWQGGLDLTLTGVMLGFAVAIPVGPIGLLCVQQALLKGRAHGHAAGIGAASADTVYGFVAGMSLNLVAGFLQQHRPWLAGAGGLFLLLYGARTLTERPEFKEARVTIRGLAGAYLSTFALTLANPLNILLFAGVFASVGVAAELADAGQAGLLAVGVGLGAAAWWLMLTSVVSAFRTRFDPRLLLWANRASGVVIIAAGLVVALQAAF